jgi:hypothetical protein
VSYLTDLRVWCGEERKNVHVICKVNGTRVVTRLANWEKEK